MTSKKLRSPQLSQLQAHIQHVNNHTWLEFIKLNRTRLSVTLILFVCLILQVRFKPLSQRACATSSPNFKWSDIKPSKTLEYTPCYGEFQCARLSVPLNWNASVSEQEAESLRVAIAIVKIPARVPVTDARYGGAVLHNPGGPGDSGVRQTLLHGKSMQAVMDSPSLSSESGKFFDLISWDPRGVNNTTPGLDCFPTVSSRDYWLKKLTDYGLLWDSKSIVGMEWALHKSLGFGCSPERDRNRIVPYLNTAQTVEDMVEIIEQEGQLRAKKAQSSDHSKRIIYTPGQEKLKFWGTSYGTVIGVTFAALHPDKVGRIVIDGVVDPADFYAGSGQHNLIDSDMIITEFSQACHKAGPDKCPLHTGSSGKDVENRFTKILQSLKTNPIPLSPFIGTNGNALEPLTGPEILTYGDVHLHLLSAMYFPFPSTEILFNLVRAIETQNITSPNLLQLLTEKQKQQKERNCQATTPPPDDTAIPYNSNLGVFQTISCMDFGGGPSNLTQASFIAYLDFLRAQSQWVSPNWGRSKLACQGFSVRPAWKPALDFTRQGALLLPPHTMATATTMATAHPLLILSNRFDPVTPLANGRRVQQLFARSVLLTQWAAGHGSLASPSLCSAGAVREYFQTGGLPRPGTVCQPDVRPFVGCVREGGCRFEGDDKVLWEALLDMSDVFGNRKQHERGIGKLPDHDSILQNLKLIV